MRLALALFLAAVELGSPFGTATAEVHDLGGASMTVEISVEVTVSADAVVAHLAFGDDEPRVLSLLNRGSGVFGIRTELEPRNYVVVFEVLGPESAVSEPKTLTELGAELDLDGRSAGSPDSDELSTETRQFGWLALALGAASLSALAFWALAGDDKSESEGGDEEE